MFVKTEKLVELLLPVESPCRVGTIQGGLSLTTNVIEILIMEGMFIHECSFQATCLARSRSITVLEINYVLTVWSGILNFTKILKFPRNEGENKGYLMVPNFVLSLFYPPFYLDFKQDLVSSPV